MHSTIVAGSVVDGRKKSISISDVFLR